ncbi:hypothetical protein glysoja_048758 [Glycine soja]|uniref:Uncharacterized protein n=1 Tax=Glycine soja TaxID=3848 RepID=A0A0B2PK80_GLYSO|nr:hypothetical protein glysoja_048758 [Glycine soja]
MRAEDAEGHGAASEEADGERPDSYHGNPQREPRLLHVNLQRQTRWQPRFGFMDSRRAEGEKRMAMLLRTTVGAVKGMTGCCMVTGSEKMGNGDNDFFKTKMENRSDMGSSTPQDPHGSDEVSSNSANETNDECNDASQ